MDTAFQQALTELKVSTRGLALMEADGVNDEATLKTKVNEYGTIAGLQKAWKISKAAAQNLLSNYLEAPDYPESVGTFFAPLAQTTGIEIGAIYSALSDYGEGDDLIEMVADGIIGEDEFVEELGAKDDKKLAAKIKLGLKKIEQANAKPEPAAAPSTSAPAQGGPSVAPAAQVMLVQAPGDDDFFRALKLGGRPEFEPVNVAATIRSAVAVSGGLYNLPKKLVAAIRAQARAERKPVGPILIEVRRELAKRSDQAALFADLIPGGGSSVYVTEADKKETMAALANVWPSFISFQGRLRAFRQEAFQTMMTGGMMAQMGAGAGLAMTGLDPAMLMGSTLQTDTYVDDSEGIIEALNGVFADMGLYASLVLAQEAVRLVKIIEKPGLPAAVGATDRDAMLRELDIGVTSDVVRAQQNLVTWVVNVVDLQNKDSASLPGVLLSLCNLGEQIPWEKLSGGRAQLGRDNFRPGMPGGNGVAGHGQASGFPPVRGGKATRRTGPDY